MAQSCSGVSKAPPPHVRARLAAVAGILAALLGCSRGNGGPPALPPQLLFVTIPESRQIAIYAATAAGGTPPLQVVTESPPDRPVDVSVDGFNDAYVANENGTVRVYTSRPDQKYKLFKHYEGSNTRLQHPTAIAVNRAGSFFVADSGNGRGRVEWFSGGANGNLVPDRVIEGARTGIHDPRGVALDGSGRFYVADSTSNRVLVFDFNAAGDAAPLAHLDGLRAPGRLAVDDLLNVLVVNTADNSLAVFNSNGPESWALAATITNPALRGLGGVAYDASGQIAVAGLDGIWFFAGGAQGAADPLRSLTGAGSFAPGGVCIH